MTRFIRLLPLLTTAACGVDVIDHASTSVEDSNPSVAQGQALTCASTPCWQRRSVEILVEEEGDLERDPLLLDSALLAAATWQAECGPQLSVRAVATADLPARGHQDQAIVVRWAAAPEVPEAMQALTDSRFVIATGAMRGVDIKLRDDLAWSDLQLDPAGALDLPGHLVHQLGHALGLEHLDTPSASMSGARPGDGPAAAEQLELRSLDAADITYCLERYAP